MKTIMTICCMFATVAIVVAAFVCGYLLGADNAEQKYSDDVLTVITENVTKVDWSGDEKTKALETRIDDLNRKVVMLNSENNELKRLLQQERDKGVIAKMGDNLSDAWDGAVVMWNDITD